MEAAGHRLRHGCLRKGHRIREGIDLTLGNHTVFPEAAIHGGADADHVGAEMAPPIPAEPAAAAKLVGIHADPLSGSDSHHLRTHRNHFSGKFMTQNGSGRSRGSTLITAKNVHICAADAAGPDFYQNLIPGHCRHLALFHAKIFFSIKNRSFHLK